MPANVQPVVFPNAAGNRLFGMLHQPSTNRNPGIAIVLLSPGIKGRIAPHRLYVKLARRLCDAGFLVLRFDFYGLGDAEGEVSEKLVADVYGSVSVGRYVDDTIAAMNWLQQEYQTERFVLSGLCGGAITGMFAGARDPRVDALVGLAIPVIQYGDNSMRYRYLSSGEQSQFRRGYLRRLLDWKSWLRLLTFRSDYSVIAKVFLSPLKRAWLVHRKRSMRLNLQTPVISIHTSHQHSSRCSIRQRRFSCYSARPTACIGTSMKSSISDRSMKLTASVIASNSIWSQMPGIFSKNGRIRRIFSTRFFLGSCGNTTQERQGLPPDEVLTDPA
jgi:alpha/beta superfamily hydrolase